jgi:hypothetical protein
MLSPAPGGLQAFKFTALLDGDRNRLQSAIELSQDQTLRDFRQIEMYRPW